MNLIFIHGRAQENFDEFELKKTWIKALKKGLKKSNLKFPNSINIEFPYYGKLLISLLKSNINKLEQEKEVSRSSSNTINKIDLEQFQIEFVRELIEQNSFGVDFQLEIQDLLEAERGIFNSQKVKDLLKLLDKNNFLSKKVVKIFTKDVFAYLSNPAIRNHINQVIRSKLNSSPSVIVGHSLGSIIGYDILKDSSHLNVKQYITLGSPLGLTSVQNYLEGSIEMPSCLTNGWINFFDLRDYIALKPLDKKHFNTSPSIENISSIQNSRNNPHGIEEYLSNKEVALAIYNAITL